MKSNDQLENINQLKREIIRLKRTIAHLKFKNSPLFKILNTINLFIYLAFLQYIISYVFDINKTIIHNKDIQFKTYPYESMYVKLYTIIFQYQHYSFKVKVNKLLNKSVLYSDALITKDHLFQIPQKFKFIYPNSHWFFINESLGILTICSILVFVQSIAYIYKQHEYFYPLFSISFLSLFAFSGILIFSLYIHNFI